VSKARKGLEPGSHARVFRAGGGFGDSIGMYRVPDDGAPLTIRDLPPGSYTARDELGNEVSFVQELGAEMVQIRTIGAESAATAQITRDEDVSPDVRAPAAPGTAVVTDPPDDPLTGIPASAADSVELMTPVERRIAEGAGTPGSDLRGDALRDRASELDIEGRSSMTADELRDAIADAEGSHEVVVEPDPQPRRPDKTQELGEAAAAVADPQPPPGTAPQESQEGVSGAGGARVSPGVPEDHDEDEIAGTAG
jgi:hypothetical protein